MERACDNMKQIAQSDDVCNYYHHKYGYNNGGTDDNVIGIDPNHANEYLNNTTTTNNDDDDNNHQ